MQHAPALRRRLTLPLLVLYGTGITVGAGIYVLIGAVAGYAGIYTPWAFVLAAIVMALTIGSYVELSSRFPVSAGEAAYVKAAFGSSALSTFTGLFTVVVGLVSSSTVTLGSVGYIKQFVDLPHELLIVAVVVILGAVAAWGILQSVILASIFTLIEVGGLIAIVAMAAYYGVPVLTTLTVVPPLELGVLSGIAFASLLAFFAFIGFEDLVNVVEEVKHPQRDLPRAMIWTLVISTALYVTIAAIAVTAVSVDRLAASSAPLSLVFREVAGVSPATISAIAVFATLNTILAQMTLATRVIYGMSRQGDLPQLLGRVHAGTGTPLVATMIIVVIVIVLALTVSFEKLAESTSLATLLVFALVNLSLLRIRSSQGRMSSPHVTVPIWVPVLGLVTCLAMIASSLLEKF